jgi:chaperonin cofactor prefoldin
MVKKGVLGAALTAGALFLAFGTSAPSYVRTAFHKVRHNAHDAVPVQFEIDRAREEIGRLEKPIHENMETYYQTQVDVDYLDKEIATAQANIAQDTKAMLTLRDGLRSGNLRTVGNVTYSADEVKDELSRRLDHLRNVKNVLAEKEATIKAKRKIMDAALKQMVTMNAQKKELLTKVDAIEARLKLIEATNATNEFNFDNSALNRVKASVTDLEKRLEVQARIAEQEGKFAEGSLPVFVEPSRDVLKEIDAEFGPASKDAKPTDKSL